MHTHAHTDIPPPPHTLFKLYTFASKTQRETLAADKALPSFLNRMTPLLLPDEAPRRGGSCAFVFRAHDFYLYPTPATVLWSQGSLEQHQEARGFYLFFTVAPRKGADRGSRVSRFSQRTSVSHWLKHRGSGVIVPVPAPPLSHNACVYFDFSTVLTRDASPSCQLDGYQWN